MFTASNSCKCILNLNVYQVLPACEQIRQANIARNNAFLAQLNIDEAKFSSTYKVNETKHRKYRSTKYESEDSDSDYEEEEEEEES